MGQLALLSSIGSVFSCFMFLPLLLYLIYYDMTRAGSSESEKGGVCLVKEIRFGKTFSDCNGRLINLLGLGRLFLILLCFT